MKVKDMFNLSPRKIKEGEVGIEIEVEGEGLPRNVSKYWEVHEDGSLRGESAEYVLREPLDRASALKSLVYLHMTMSTGGAKVGETYRAGVHVHLNAQHLEFKDLLNLITLYYLFEESLVRYCGETRQGNLFCLRSSDADWVINLLTTCIKRKDLSLLNNDDIRYASMNMRALYTYGSLEFRAMRSTQNIKDVWNWVKLLLCLKDSCTKFESPADVVASLSGMGVEEFTHTVFGLECSGLLNKEYLYEDVYSGVSNAQDVAYCVDWDSYFDPVSKNPFKQNPFSV